MATSPSPRPPGRTCVQVGLAVSLCVFQAGCAAFLAATTPTKRDLGVLSPGMPRALVVHELGEPVESREPADGTMDVFIFDQGYPEPVRFSRTAGHSFGTVMTLGLWEIAGIPLELAFRGEEVQVAVDYTADGKVCRVQYYKGAHLADGSLTIAEWARPKSTVQTAVIEERTSPDEPSVLQASFEVDAEAPPNNAPTSPPGEQSSASSGEEPSL